MFQTCLKHGGALRISLNLTVKGSLRSSGSLSKKGLLGPLVDLCSSHLYKTEAFTEKPP